MYGIILAGGSGSRLWPMSRELYPKQLIRMNGKKSLLEETYLRLKEIMPVNNIISITNSKHASDVKTQLGDITKNPKILIEPSQRNTAPAISAATKYITDHTNEDPIILVVPSDHLIQDLKGFQESIAKGLELAEKGSIVTFGIQPTHPHTGYGYIRVIPQSQRDLKIGLTVKEFVEKPDSKRAQGYVQKGNYYWNSGIFMFKASAYLKALSLHAPGISEVVKKMNFKVNPIIDFDLFDSMPNISIDYAVMEKVTDMVLVPLQSDWNDLGSWDAIYSVTPKDAYNNVITGNVMNEGSENCLLYSNSRLVAAVGLSNIAVIETSDAVLVCQKDQTQNVKKIYDKLKESKNEAYLAHKTVYRPWGYYTVLEEGDGFLIKTISVNPSAKLSLQLHHHRSEHWIIVKGHARVILDDKTLDLEPGQSVDIPLEAKHSLQNPYNEELQIIEVQRGDLISEDDIERFEDLYGRV